jgi:hypothetical protein
MYSRTRLLLLILLSTCFFGSAQAPPPPDLILQGKVQPTQNQTYIEVPFVVPDRTHRISVSFRNFGKDEHTVIDLGIADPFRFRGASGGNKDNFTIGETDATPSYLPGAIPAGRWKLLFSVPNIRPGVISSWRAEIWFNRTVDDSSFTEKPLRDTPGWYRGDLHTHTAHSDGSCPSQSGKSVPCPLFLTTQAAARRGLDFIAISDHNTTSHYNAERELQSYYDELLFIPGRELTTFSGHANVFGTTRFIDFRVGTQQVPDANTMFRDARSLGAIVSINHPELPMGEICMGCGWTPNKPVDWDLVTSIEVVNGGGVPATRFWEKQLREGHRLTAIGGSDNHHAEWLPEKPGSIGYPTTVVYAQKLSVAAILDGVRSGRVFIDVTGSSKRLLDMSARAGSASANMGGDLEPHGGESVAVEIHVVGCEGAELRFLLDGKQSPALPPLAVSSADQVLHSRWQADGDRHWIRVEVHDAQNHLILFGNPVYIGFDSQKSH